MLMRIKYYSEFFLILLQKDLKVRYKRSVLGYFWALLNPLAYASVYYIVFNLIMRFDIPNYPIFLLTALFPWVWITNSLINGTLVFKNNSSLIKKANLKKIVLPLSSTAHETMHFIFSLPIIFIFIFYANLDFYFSWIWQIPLLIITQYYFLSSIVIIFSILNCYVNDIEYMVGIFLSLFFFLTPIVYSIEMVPQKYLFFYEILSKVYSDANHLSMQIGFFSRR